MRNLARTGEAKARYKGALALYGGRACLLVLSGNNSRPHGQFYTLVNNKEVNILLVGPNREQEALIYL